LSPKVGDLVVTRPELLRALDDDGPASGMGMVISLVKDPDGTGHWPLIRWTNGEFSLPIPTDLVVISEP